MPKTFAKKPITCHVCDTVFTSNFCPECGLKYDDVKKPEVPTFITMYVNGDKEDGYHTCNKLRIDEKSKLGQQIISATYEIKLIYKIDGEKLLLHQVDAGDGQGLLDVVKK